MLEKFDDEALEIIKDAIEYTNRNYKISKVGTESFLYVMFRDEDSLCNLLLEDYRVTLDEIKDIISKYVIIRNNNKEYTDKFLEVIEMAKVISKENNSEFVGEEHLLFALLVVKDTIFEDEIRKLNLNSLALIEDLKSYFNLRDTDEIEAHSVNMTKLAKNNKLNKMIGRNEYLERMKIVLSRKNKNNILLVGSAGVGKTALVEGLCYDLLASEKEYNVISINIASIIANTKYRGDFEAKINKLLNEVIELENAIIFIDEMHTIVGAGSSENLLDVSNIIKPYLVRNNFRCIGATTIDEYQKSIAKDKALVRRFQPIFVNELTIYETEEVLLGIKSDYEEFHQVELKEEYIKQIIKLAQDKIFNRKFPDKAIDLMDEAMCIAKTKGHKIVKHEHIYESLKNITGIEIGNIDYEYKYQELLPFILDNYLGVNNNKNLVSINFSGNDANLKLLLDEIELGFGIKTEMILELNLANYKENYSMSSLIGSPPGYVGYDDGGILSEHFSKFFYQIIVINNLSMAAFEVQDFFKNMLEKGVFYDKKGREFKTCNTVFIFKDEEVSNTTIGFLGNKKTSFEIKSDLYLSNKVLISVSNPYKDSFMYRGFDLVFNEEEFDDNKDAFKLGFLEVLNNNEKGRYKLIYNYKTNKVDVLK